MRAKNRLRVVHIINSFEFGGAEEMLCNLLLRADAARFDVSAVSLIDDLTVAAPLLDACIPLTTMHMQPGVPNPLALLRLASHLHSVKPDIVQTWMDHSNLIGGLAARLGCRAPVVWGIHHANHVHGLAKRTTLMTVRACAALSHALPSRIVCCSRESRALYAERGFAERKLAVIPNGFDTARFRPDPESRRDVRRELAIDESTELVGLVARFDPLKDHGTFLRAAAALAARRPNLRFLLCGDKVDDRNAALTGLVQSLGLAGRCHLVGPRRDMPRIIAALDLAVSSSISEAFPLVVGEAMSCGVPCVVTDVGDSAYMVGDTGRVVRPRDAAALAAAAADLLAMERGARTALGLRARERVCASFELSAIARRYEALYDDIVAEPEPRHLRTGKSVRPIRHAGLEPSLEGRLCTSR